MDIAIIGLGCRFPSAANPLAFWELIRDGRVVFRPVPKSRWNHEAFLDSSLRAPDKAYIERGGYLEDEELRAFGALHFGIAPRRVQVTDPQHRILLDAVRGALEDAGLDAPRSLAPSLHPAAGAWDRSRCGVFIGASVAEHKELLSGRLRAMQLLQGQFGRKLDLDPKALEELALALSQDVVPMRAFSIAGNLLNMAAAVVAQQWDLGGPAYALDAACSSALVATQQAIVNLRAGAIDTAIAGGVYLNLLPDNLVGFSRIGAISRQGECRPFDAGADGFVMGEGVGVTILKRLDDALRDGDRVYAVVRGAGCNNDGKGEGPMTPRPAGQLAALRLAYRDAGVEPTTLGYIEAHGTATTVGDVVEVGALRQLFEESGWQGSSGARTALGSVKANIGHTMSAAGAAGLIKATLALHTRTLPPQPSVNAENPKLGLAQPGGEQGPFFLPQTAQPWPRGEHPRRAAVSSFGFGGTNAHLVLEEAPLASARPVRVQVPAQLSRQPWASEALAAIARSGLPVHALREPRPDAKARSELLVLSGPNAQVVAQAARELALALPQLEREGHGLADLALTLSTRALLPARLCVVADSFAQLAERLAGSASALEAPAAGAQLGAPNGSASTTLAPRALVPGATFAQGPFEPAANRIALLFPGQGAQQLFLLRELDEELPLFRARFDALDAALGPELHAQLGGTLRSFLYPSLPLGPDGAPDAQARLAAEARLKETQRCQPVMAALGLSLHALLETLGLQSHALLGHSLGEFAAAAAAGVLSPEECVRFVARRGLAMVALPLDDRGAMASCAAGRASVEAVLAGLPSVHRADAARPVVAANLNHPQQTVISGDSEGVRAACALLEQHSIKCTPLEVSHAFHSPLVAGVEGELGRLVSALELRAPQTALISGITSALYPSAPERIREIWVRHATAPVDFMGALQTAAAPAPAGAGARLFVQVGAGNALNGFAKSTLAESDRLGTTALAARGDDGLAQFHAALALLVCAGAPLDLGLLYAGRAQLLALPPTPLETQSYWVLETPTAPRAPILLDGMPHEATSQRSEQMDPMVALFREQVALLQTQAQVLQRQAEALANQGALSPEQLAALPALPAAMGAVARDPAAHPNPGTPPGASTNPSTAPSTSTNSSTSTTPGTSTTPSTSTSPSPTTSPPPSADALRAEVSRLVLASVARISAFPASAIKSTQTLAGELGFDSLMTVELDGDVQKAFPTAGGLPRSLLSATVTVQAVIDHLVLALSSPQGAANLPVLSSTLGDVASSAPELLPFVPVAIEVKRGPTPLESTLPHALLLIRDAHGVAAALAARLAGSGHEVVLVDSAQPASPLRTLAPRLHQCGSGDDIPALFRLAARTTGPIGSVIHLGALGQGSTLAAIVSKAQSGRFELRAELLPLLDVQRFARAQSKAGDAASGGHFIVVTSQGGRFGLDSASTGTGAVLASALAGFTKSLGRERADELVKRIDLDLSAGADALADALLTELNSDDASSEIGLANGKRFERELQAAPTHPAVRLEPGDLVLVSGGAKGVGLKLACELAAQTPGLGFILAGRSAAGRESEAALELLRKGRARATYLQWDVSQPAPAQLAELLRELGPVRAILHAAGVSEDGPSANKDEAQLLRVIAPKLAGIAQLLAATAEQPLKLLLFTTSWSGHFGNAGQTDYAAGNAALGAVATLLPALRPGVTALALGLPPWEGTTLVSRIPSFAKAALIEQGVPFINDARGAEALRNLLAAGAQGDLLLAQSRPQRAAVLQTQHAVDRRAHLYLDDHQLAGQPVLPLASALDLLGDAAMQAAGGSARSLLVRDLSLRMPVRITDSALLSVRATGDAKPGAELSLSLTSSPLAGPRPFSRAPSYAAFATPGADVASALASARPAPAASGPRAPLPLSLEEFYATATFHGPRMQGIASIESISPQGIVGWVRTSKPSDLIRDSARKSWTVDPLALDGAFQLAGYWAWTQLGRAGFPIGIQEYAALWPLSEGPLRASLTLEQSHGDVVRGTIVLQGEGGKVVAVVRGVEGEFKHRDPRFLRARGLSSVKPQESDGLEAPQSDFSRAAPSMSAPLESSTARSEAPAAPPSKSPAPPATATSSPSAPAPAVAEELYRVELFPEVQELEQRLGLAQAFGLKNPYFNVHERVTNDTSVIGGRTMINWSSYNYVGLSGDSHVTKAAQAAVERYGTSVSASRIASGEKPLHRELEQELAQFLGCEDAVVMVSGHGVFVTVIGHLMGDGDLILHDSLAHDCIMGGAKLSGAKRRPFPHNDFAALERQLEQLRPHYKRVLIAVEGVYSMDGDITPLPEFIRLKKKYGALLLVDEAHSLGVLGPRGRGVGEHFGVDRADVDLWMGTMSKSLASCGGYVAGTKALVQYLKYTTPGFVFSVGITPANAAAGLEALRQLQQHPEKVQRLHERARLFLQLAREKGIDTGMASGAAVVPAIVGNSLHSLQLSEALRQRGINVQPILYPAVEETAARLRFFVTATHTEQQIRETVEVLAEELAKVRADPEMATGSV